MEMRELHKVSVNLRFSNGIPRIIHYNYKNNKLPSQYVPLVKECLRLNPDIQFVFWSDESAKEFIKDYFPSYSLIYQSYFNSREALKKSDLLRYFLLSFYGGIYMDLDTRCQKPMKVIMHSYKCVLGKEVDVQAQILWNVEYMATNSFMACAPNHEFFKFALKNLRRDDNSHIMYQTGPLFLTDRFNTFIKMNKDTKLFNESSKYISLGSSDIFSPFIEAHLERYCKNPSTNPWIKRCKDLQEYRKQQKHKMAEAVVVHLFYHLGYDFAKHNIKELVDVYNTGNVCVMIRNKNS